MEQEGTKEVKTKKNKGSSFMKNVLILMFSQVTVKILGLIYRIVITNLEGFGDTGLGYYSAGYQVYSLLLAVSSIGIPNVISKLVSERLAIGDNKGAQRVFRIAMTFFTGLGIILSLILFFGAETIATVVFNVPDTKYIMQVLAPAIAFVSASAVFRGYFSGQNDMKLTSYSQIIEQFFNCVLSITFVYALIGKEPYIMAAGGNLSTTCAIILTFMYIIIYYKRKKIKVDKKQISPERKKSSKQILKTILALSLPATFGSIISVVSPLIDSTTVSRCIQTAFASVYPIKEELEAFAMSMTGIMSKVDTIVTLPVSINIAFATALVPAISSALARKSYKEASKRMSFSLFASLLIVIPCACGIIGLAQPILKLIYPTASDGFVVLMLCAVSMIFIAMSHTVNGGLTGLNDTVTPTIASIVAIIIKLTLNIVLISNPAIGIYGAGISSIIAQGTAFTISTIVMSRKLKLNIGHNFKRMVLGPITSGVIMGVSVHFINQGLNTVLGSSVSTIVSILCGVIIYGLTILVFRVLQKEDLFMIPFGTKIYPILVKIGIYKEEPELAVDTEANELKISEEEVEDTMQIETEILSEVEMPIITKRIDELNRREKNRRHKPKHMK